jgi:hypothetical protein
MERLCIPAEERTHRRLPLPFAMMSEDELRPEAEPEKRTHRRLPLPFAMMSEDESATEAEAELKPVDLVGKADLSYKGLDQHYSPSKYKTSDPACHQPWTDYLRSLGSEQGTKMPRKGGGPNTGKYAMVCQCGAYFCADAATKSGTEAENIAGYTYKDNIELQSLVNQCEHCLASSATGAALPKKCRTKRSKKGGWGSISKPRLTYDRKHDRFNIAGYNI